MEPEPLDLIAQNTANMLQGYLAQHGVQTILQDSTGGAWLTTKSIPYKENMEIRFVIVCFAKTWPEVEVRVISRTGHDPGWEPGDPGWEPGAPFPYYTEDFIATEHVDISNGFEGVLDIYNQYAGDHHA